MRTLNHPVEVPRALACLLMLALLVLLAGLALAFNGAVLPMIVTTLAYEFLLPALLRAANARGMA